MAAHDGLEREIAAIGDLPRVELAGEWQRIYSYPPPKGLHRELLVRAVSWHLQAKRLGGFSVGTRQKLRSLIDDADRKATLKQARLDVRGRTGQVGDAPIAVDASASAPAKTDASKARIAGAGKPRRRLSQGARLIRDWNGRAHVVDVIDPGFVYDGKLYSSLTAIAFAITGTRWSGPRFFGL
ncbi:DUF2924 domain-containing protein [Mesorhizobium sp. IMUNJ 23232]|uniref:DUF2924 domain-containing protein n=1 Tax=Mesorhizobium sp. IMUNJ 23232 TaxID=3376064 RepID=UPI0037BAB30C